MKIPLHLAIGIFITASLFQGAGDSKKEEVPFLPRNLDIHAQFLCVNTLL